MLPHHVHYSHFPQFDRLEQILINWPKLRDAADQRGSLPGPLPFVYGIGARTENRYDTADQLVKLDNDSGEATIWRESGCYPGEPVFVARPGGRQEDDGIVLSVVLDAKRQRSLLLVLDGRSFEELGRAWAPHVIPHGIHGAFFGNEGHG